MRRRPQPFPYQGSKRLLADRILALCGPGARFERLIEPFAGSAAIAVAALDSGIVSGVVINDALVPLAELWSRIIDEPTRIGDEYEVTWREQFDEGAHFERIRARFNAERSPADLLYVLARCVKAALRFNGDGEFNQSADRRRHGMKPVRFRLEASAAARLLHGRSTVMTGDFRRALDVATPRDLVYLDPPYAGVSGRDRRYHAQIDRTAIVEAIERLNDARIPFLLSYDGMTGARTYGAPLPDDLGMVRVLLRAGRSSQATLLARDDETIESVYVSAALTAVRPRESRGRPRARPLRYRL